MNEGKQLGSAELLAASPWITSVRAAWKLIFFQANEASKMSRFFFIHRKTLNLCYEPYLSCSALKAISFSYIAELTKCQSCSTHLSDSTSAISSSTFSYDSLPLRGLASSESSCSKRVGVLLLYGMSETLLDKKRCHHERTALYTWPLRL